MTADPTVEQLIRETVHVLASALLDPWEIDAARIDYAGRTHRDH